MRFWVYQDFHTGTFLSIGTKVEAERLLLYERWDFLCKLEMVGEEGAFVIGREEVLTEEELAATLKVNAQNEYLELDERKGGLDRVHANAARIG